MAVDGYSTVEEFLTVVFSVKSVPKLCKGDYYCAQSNHRRKNISFRRRGDPISEHINGLGKLKKYGHGS
jgi:hypothetical protein